MFISRNCCAICPRHWLLQGRHVFSMPWLSNFSRVGLHYVGPHRHIIPCYVLDSCFSIVNFKQPVSDLHRDVLNCPLVYNMQIPAHQFFLPAAKSTDLLKFLSFFGNSWSSFVAREICKQALWWLQCFLLPFFCLMFIIWGEQDMLLNCHARIFCLLL